MTGGSLPLDSDTHRPGWNGWWLVAVCPWKDRCTLDYEMGIWGGGGSVAIFPVNTICVGWKGPPTRTREDRQKDLKLRHILYDKVMLYLVYHNYLVVKERTSRFLTNNFLTKFQIRHPVSNGTGPGGCFTNSDNSKWQIAWDDGPSPGQTVRRYY